MLGGGGGGGGKKEAASNIKCNQFIAIPYVQSWFNPEL